MDITCLGTIIIIMTAEKPTKTTTTTGRCAICGGPGVSDAYYCKECTVAEKDVSVVLLLLLLLFLSLLLLYFPMSSPISVVVVGIVDIFGIGSGI